MTSGAPSRSWISAGCTSAPTSRPPVSVTMWRLRPLTFLGRLSPGCPAALGRFGRLPADAPGGGPRSAPRRPACFQHKLKFDRPKQAVVPPIVEVALYGRERRKVLWQHPPLTAGPHN